MSYGTLALDSAFSAHPDDSLLPAPMHVDVAKLCIAHGKHLVTASYISPEMKELDKRSVKRAS